MMINVTIDGKPYVVPPKVFGLAFRNFCALPDDMACYRQDGTSIDTLALWHPQEDEALTTAPASDEQKKWVKEHREIELNFIVSLGRGHRG